ncbi:MAG TPA: hypothetical protein VKJ47_05175 [Candidatus Binatia bacterium]|nr:hypothetical protein [Candidatus Binatia bacterium]
MSHHDTSIPHDLDIQLDMLLRLYKDCNGLWTDEAFTDVARGPYRVLDEEFLRLFGGIMDGRLAWAVWQKITYVLADDPRELVGLEVFVEILAGEAGWEWWGTGQGPDTEEAVIPVRATREPPRQWPLC